MRVVVCYWMRAGRRRTAEPMEVGALRCYDRPQPTTGELRPVVAELSSVEGGSMSTVTVAVQQSTIRQYCSSTAAADLRRTVCSDGRGSHEAKDGPCRYLEALLAAEIEERERNAVARQDSLRQSFRK